MFNITNIKHRQILSAGDTELPRKHCSEILKTKLQDTEDPDVLSIQKGTLAQSYVTYSQMKMFVGQVLLQIPSI